MDWYDIEYRNEMTQMKPGAEGISGCLIFADFPRLGLDKIFRQK